MARPGLLSFGRMRAVIQRVSRASVTVDDVVRGQIQNGLLVLLGVRRGDTEKDADYLAEKITWLRVFEDAAGKMNLSLKDAGGELLVVSQFTVYGDCSRGRRPSFDAAAPAETARVLYSYFVDRLRQSGVRVAEGVFQAHMLIENVNDGPLTIIVESPDAA